MRVMSLRGREGPLMSGWAETLVTVARILIMLVPIWIGGGGGGVTRPEASHWAGGR